MRNRTSDLRIPRAELQRFYSELGLYFISNFINKRLPEWMKTLNESKLECMNDLVIDKRLIDWMTSHLHIPINWLTTD